MELNREQIRDVLATALEPLAFINAMWEGGSAAWGRADEYSDLDLMVDAEETHVAQAIEAVESALAALSPISHVYALPEPTWHGFSQRFYRLKDAPPWLLIDLCVCKSSDRGRFNEVELHGHPLVIFDKCNAVSTSHIDADEHRAKLKARIEELKSIFPMFEGFVRKELLRGNGLGALQCYQQLVMRPLFEMVMIKNSPWRYNFGLRYAPVELPGAVVAELEALHFVGSVDELEAKQKRASELFWESAKMADSSSIPLD